jgi:hypothetical protein
MSQGVNREGKRVEKLPDDYSAYDKPGVFERMFSGANAINIDTD